MSILAIDGGLSPIRNRFLKMLMERQHDIQRDLELALNRPKQAQEALGRIEGILHKLAGTAGTLGFVALGQTARDVENAIIADRNGQVDPTGGLYLQIIDVLEKIMEITQNTG